MWVWGPPIPSTSLDGCGFFNSIVVRLPFNSISDDPEWWLFYILIVILMWLCKELSHVFLHRHLPNNFLFNSICWKSGLFCLFIHEKWHTYVLRYCRANNFMFWFFTSILIGAFSPDITCYFSKVIFNNRMVFLLVHVPNFSTIIIFLDPFKIFSYA